MITQQQAQELINKHITTDWLKKHSLETEMIMRSLAKHFNENEDLWGITGLLHDLDFDLIDKNDPKEHSLKTCEILDQEFGLANIPAEMIHAIKAHAEAIGFAGVKRETKLDFALSAAENLSGFIVACALVMPDKKLSSLNPERIIKRLKEKSFAAKVKREYIYDIEKTDLDLSNFVKLALESLTPIATEIGL